MLLKIAVFKQDKLIAMRTASELGRCIYAHYLEYDAIVHGFPVLHDFIANPAINYMERKVAVAVTGGRLDFGT